MKTLRILLTICFGLSAATLVAQSRHYNSRTLGMGGGGTAIIDGYHANFLNPANLMLDDGRTPKTQLGLVGGVGVRTGGSLLNVSVYNQYLTKGLTIDGTIRENMLNDWFGAESSNMKEFSTSVDVVPFGFSRRAGKQAIGLAARARVINDMSLSKGFAELLFYGLDSDKFSSPVALDMTEEVVGYMEFSLGYARSLPVPLKKVFTALPFINDMKLYAGVAPKYLVGLQSAEFDFNSTLQIDPADQFGNSITHDFDYSIYSYGDLSKQLSRFARDHSSASNPADVKLNDYISEYDGSDVGSVGSGFAWDLGVTAELDVSLPIISVLSKKQTLRISMSATDLGSITYDKNASRVYADDAFIFNADLGDDSPGDYFDALPDSLQNHVYGAVSSQSTKGKKITLPGMYNFGAALIMGKLTTTLDYGVGFNDYGTNSKRSTLTLGAEYRFLGFIPLRVGTRIGGYASTAYSAGIGIDLRFLELSVSAATVANSESDGSSAAVAVSGLLFRF